MKRRNGQVAENKVLFLNCNQLFANASADVVEGAEQIFTMKLHPPKSLLFDQGDTAAMEDLAYAKLSERSMHLFSRLVAGYGLPTPRSTKLDIRFGAQRDCFARRLHQGKRKRRNVLARTKRAHCD